MEDLQALGGSLCASTAKGESRGGFFFFRTVLPQKHMTRMAIPVVQGINLQIKVKISSVTLEYILVKESQAKDVSNNL